MEKDEALHYLELLSKNYTVFQPEIRDAIDFAIGVVERANLEDKE